MLVSRLHRPNTCSDAIMRDRLFERLHAGLDNLLTVISAPAGAGKTTLLTSWLDSLAENEGGLPSFQVAWLSVDPALDNPQTFFAALIDAIESAFPDACAEARDLLQSSTPMAWPYFTQKLLEACAALPVRLVLVIDDYHLISDSTVHEVLSQLIRAWHPQVHPIILSRTHPPLGLTQLRVRHQLNELIFRDLQFDAGEAGAFVRESTRIDVTASFADALQQCTEGWAAGLRLATLSLQQRGDMNAFIRDFKRNSNRFIMDYLLDEALKNQPAALQSFLLRTAVLPRLCSALCAVVVDGFTEDECQATLEQLEQRNLFIVNLDDQRNWYRYHHQFQSMLNNVLRREIGEAGINALRRRAATWLAGNGYPDEAIDEYVRLKAFDAAAEIIEDHIVALQNDEAWTRLARWLALMPEEVINRRPGLLIARGWVGNFQNAYAAIRATIPHIQALLDAADEATQTRWRAQFHALQSAGSITLDIDERLRAAHSAHTLAPVTDVWMRATAAYGEIVTLVHIGDYTRSRALLRECLEDPSYSDGRALARLHQAGEYTRYYEGDLPSVIWHADHARKLAQQHHMPMTSGWALAFLGAAHWHRNELPAAERYFKEVFEKRFSANQHAVAASTYMLFNILTARGAFHESHDMALALHELESATKNISALRIADALDAYLAIKRGGVNAAMAWANTSPLGISREPDMNYPDASILIQVLLADKTPASLSRAEHVTSQALTRCRFMHDDRSTHEALVWMAQVKCLQGCKDGALEALAPAVTFAQPRGILRWFINGGEHVKELLKQLARDRRCAEQARAILAAWPANDAAQPANHRDAALLLTYREIEVLELIAEKLTNKEIAARLHISPITVRNHTSNIYDKLQVATRREAVVQARSLRLIA
jgi:LuxR family maltose regulon positive regulatory protein